MIIVLPAMWEMENMEKDAQRTSLTSASMGRPCCGRGEGEVRKGHLQPGNAKKALRRPVHEGPCVCVCVCTLHPRQGPGLGLLGKRSGSQDWDWDSQTSI